MNGIINHLTKAGFIRGLIISLIILCSCSKPDDCVKSTGKIIEEERPLSSFSVIHVSDNVQLHLTDNGGSTIRVKAGENIISNIETKVIGNVLFITNENKCNWLRSYKKDIIVYVGAKDIETVYNYGSANINSDWLNKEALFFHHYGNGDVHLKINSKRIWMDMDHLGDFNIEGTTHLFNATSLNLGELKAQNLLADTIWLTSDAQGHCYVRPTKIIGASIKNSGNVYYYGNPISASAARTGTGQLIKAD